MAITSYQIGSLQFVTVLSTDTKPTGSVRVGSLCYETDTGDKYEYDGNSWIQVADNGSGYTSVQADYRGVYPASYYLNFTGSAGTNDNDVVYTSNDISMYNVHYIEGTAGTVDIQVSVDGTNFNTTQAAVLLHDDVTTGGGVNVLTIASGKIGVLRGKYKKLRILQNGATGSNARGAHVWE